MGRTKGSKNGFRKIPIPRKFGEEQKYVIVKKTLISESDSNLTPVFDENVLLAYKQKDYEKCITMIETILTQNESDENTDHYKILKAASFTMLGQDFTTAHNILNEVLALNPFNSFALYGKGVAFYFQKKFDLSVDQLSRAIEANPGHEMQRAKELKVRIDLERRRAVIFIKKVDFKDSDISKENSRRTDDIINTEISNAEKYELDEESPIISQSNLDENEFSEIPESATNQYNVLKIKPKIKSLNQETPEVAFDESKNDPDIITTSAIYNEDDQPTADNEEERSSIINPCNAEEFYDRGMEFYTRGVLKNSLKMFGKAVKLDPTFESAEEMGAKAQELLELMDVATLNMSQKNYQAVVSILNEALEIDESNHFVNRPFFFQRGLAYYHLGMNDESLKDYAEFERINKMICEK